MGSELIQKYLGDGPKLVRELFRVAEEHAPSIVFIDEIDAVGTKRYDSNSGGEREIQRTMLELLNQLDGFDSRYYFFPLKFSPIKSQKSFIIRAFVAISKYEYKMKTVPCCSRGKIGSALRLIDL